MKVPNVTTNIEVLKLSELPFIAIWWYGDQWWCENLKYDLGELLWYDDLKEEYVSRNQTYAFQIEGRTETYFFIY